MSCTENGVDNDNGNLDSKDYIAHSFLLSVHEKIDFQTNEYIRISWENRSNSYLVKIDNKDSNGVDWFIKTEDNFIEFPSSLSPKDYYKFDTNAVYSIEVWSYHNSNEVSVDQAILVNADISLLSKTTANTDTIVDSSIAIICIYGKDSQDTLTINKVKDSSGKYKYIDTLTNIVGKTVSGTDTIDLIDSFFVITRGNFKTNDTLMMKFDDTLISYLISDSAIDSLVTFSFKDVFVPAPEIKEISKTGSIVKVEILGDTNRLYSVIMVDLKTDAADTQNVNGQDTAIFANVLPDNSYKIYAISNSGTWFGKADSLYLYNNEDLFLPFKYYSTFSIPDTIVNHNLRSVKGGVFLMGDLWQNNYSSISQGAKPVHEVMISSFYMGINEITVGEYLEYLEYLDNEPDNNPSKLKMSLTDSILIFDNYELAYINNQLWNLIVNVDPSGIVDSITFSDSSDLLKSAMSLTWEGAILYCNWLTSKDADATLSECYKHTQDTVNGKISSFWTFDSSANGYRLPTEAEWEYVASRAFDTSKERYCSDSLFVNMSDNAREWVTDVNDKVYGIFNDSSYFYQKLSKGVSFNPCNRNGDREGNVARGAGIYSSQYEKQSFFRHLGANAQRGDIGFRLARKR